MSCPRGVCFGNPREWTTLLLRLPFGCFIIFMPLYYRVPIIPMWPCIVGSSGQHPGSPIFMVGEHVFHALLHTLPRSVLVSLERFIPSWNNRCNNPGSPRSFPAKEVGLAAELPTGGPDQNEATASHPSTLQGSFGFFGSLGFPVCKRARTLDCEIEYRRYYSQSTHQKHSSWNPCRFDGV